MKAKEQCRLAAYYFPLPSSKLIPVPTCNLTLGVLCTNAINYMKKKKAIAQTCTHTSISDISQASAFAKDMRVVLLWMLYCQPFEGDLTVDNWSFPTVQKGRTLKHVASWLVASLLLRSSSYTRLLTTRDSLGSHYIPKLSSQD